MPVAPKFTAREVPTFGSEATAPYAVAFLIELRVCDLNNEELWCIIYEKASAKQRRKMTVETEVKNEGSGKPL